MTEERGAEIESKIREVFPNVVNFRWKKTDLEFSVIENTGYVNYNYLHFKQISDICGTLNINWDTEVYDESKCPTCGPIYSTELTVYVKDIADH